MRRPISKGYYCIFVKEGEKSKRSPLMQEDLDAIVKQMRLLVEQNLPFYRHEVRSEEALQEMKIVEIARKSVV